MWPIFRTFGFILGAALPMFLVGADGDRCFEPSTNRYLPINKTDDYCVTRLTYNHVKNESTCEGIQLRTGLETVNFTNSSTGSVNLTIPPFLPFKTGCYFEEGEITCYCRKDRKENACNEIATIKVLVSKIRRRNESEYKSPLSEIPGTINKTIVYPIIRCIRTAFKNSAFDYEQKLKSRRPQYNIWNTSQWVSHEIHIEPNPMGNIVAIVTSSILLLGVLSIIAYSFLTSDGVSYDIFDPIQPQVVEGKSDKSTPPQKTHSRDNSTTTPSTAASTAVSTAASTAKATPPV